MGYVFWGVIGVAVGVVFAGIVLGLYGLSESRWR